MKEQFDERRASNYDRKIRLLAPGYETLHRMLNQLLSSLLPKKAHILVVGAGTGMDIVTCGTANPQWEFMAVEPSPEMFALCRNNIVLAGLDKRVHLHCGYTSELASAAQFDAAISIFVSHFIQQESDKLKFFSDIAARLRDGAYFVAADLHGDKNSDEFNLLLNGWRKFYASQDVGEQEVETAFSYIQQDISFISESRFIQLLQESGFTEAYAFFRAFLFGGWICRKSL